MISVIIPVYLLDQQLVDLTTKCLQTLKDTGRDYELIIVDNGSPIRMDFDCDIYVRNKINTGQAHSWNQGLRLAKGDHLLLADNDVEFGENWEKMAEYADKTIVFPLTKCKEEDHFSAKLAGFFWMMSQETYRMLGDVCEDYGLGYYEDTDYYMNAQLKGIKLKCIDSVKVKHYGRATAEKIEDIDGLVDINNLKYRLKWRQYPVLN